ncbi:MAG: RES family NAD+ phosphorylase [Gelidibacter sp.]
MKLYRIAKQIHLNDLSGEGARLFGGRWNKKGYGMLYTSEHLSLSALEMLVHADYKYIGRDFGYIELDLPDDLLIDTLPKALLQQDWRHNPPLVFTQEFGTQWLNSEKSLAIKVPSAVLPSENNLLINPNHPFFKDITIIKKAEVDIDGRVFG